jgi:uncharacterized protein YndB with AHSA1/START domain
MLRTILVAVVVIIAAVLLYATSRPSSFGVERTVSINAPPEKIFPLINDLRSWKSWSPYEKKDPSMKMTYSGPAEGKGATFEWQGNREVGSGQVQITESDPPSKILLRLDRSKPFEGHELVDFTLKPEGEATQVTWALHGHNPYVAKVMGIFFNMDKMIGKDFESGLAQLKVVAEK